MKQKFIQTCTIVFLQLVCIYPPPLNAQTASEERVTIELKDVPVKRIFSAIAKQTGIHITYSNATVDDNERTTVSVKNATIQDVLEKIYQQRRFEIRRTGPKTMVLTMSYPVSPEHSKKGTNLQTGASPAPVSLSPQERILSGRVVDRSGRPIPSATVTVLGANRGQGTNADGEFSFAVLPLHGKLVISSLGFDTKQVNFGSETTITVVLDTLIRDIQSVEVFSTGYQTIPKDRATGSFVQVDAEVINRGVSSNVLDRIINFTSSLRFEPRPIRGGGNSSDISIRGFSTIMANMKPLIVVDGFPYEEINSIGEASILNFLNPNDIESITVLRDAAASAIWGARAGNGVLVINTKKGRFNQKLRLQLTASYNITQKPDIFGRPIISSKDAIDFETTRFNNGTYNQFDDQYAPIGLFPSQSGAVEIMLARRRGEITAAQAEQMLNRLANHDVRNDIYNTMMRNEVNQQYALGLSGGSGIVSYYGSLGYNKSLSTKVGEDYDRITARFETNLRPVQKLDVNTFITYTQSKSHTPVTDYTQYLATGLNKASPYTSFYNADGTLASLRGPSDLRTKYVDTINIPGLLDWKYNPLTDLQYAHFSNTQNSTRLGGSVKYSVLPFLSLEARGQYEHTTGATESLYDQQSFFVRDLVNRYMSIGTGGLPQYPVPIGAILDFNDLAKNSWNLRGQLNLNKTWSLGTLSGVFGAERSETKISGEIDRKYGYNPSTSIVVPTMDYKTLFPTRPFGTTAIPNRDAISGNLNRFVSYFGTASFYFLDRFTASGSLRFDGSNFFGINANQRIRPLWSAGGSWDIHNEAFFNLKWVNSLKLRATYGFSGNVDNSATSLPTANYQNPAAGYHNFPTAFLSNPPNPGLQWERIGMTNVGLDFSLLKRALSGSIEYYGKKGVDLIGTDIVEPTAGITQFKSNYASIKGHGFDIILNSSLGKTLNWVSNILLSYTTDEVTSYKNPNPSANGYLLGGTPIIGKPLARLYAYQSAGLSAVDGSPQGYVNGKVAAFAAVIKDAKPADLVYAGTQVPQYFGSWRNTVSFKDLSLSVGIIYKFGYSFVRSSIDYGSLASNWGGHSDYALRWKKPGDETVTRVPALGKLIDDRSTFMRRSTDLIENGGVVRLQDIRLSYAFTKQRFRALPFANAQLFIFANDIGMIWKANKANLDPDLVAGGRTPRSVAFGTNISF